MPDRPRILIACLDWGLGHAARSLPVADALQALGAEPVLASSGAAGAFLRAERPGLRYLSLPAYSVHYSSSSMVLNMAMQAPKLAATAWREHQLLQQYIDEYHLSGVISDNRFGCFSHKVPCVFLTHQLRPIMPYRFLQPLTNKLVQVFVQRFAACWVPDLPDAGSLSGRLSHPPLFKTETNYIGWLSRFPDGPQESPEEEQCDSLSVLSGPEPQRTYLEQLLLPQLHQLPGQHILVRGIPVEVPMRREGTVQIYNYLKGQDLWRAVQKAEVLIGRPGYSSLMDWSIAGKKALCIPTPGQTEQIYLAHRLQAEGRIAVQTQKSLQLWKGVQQARKCQGLQAPDSGDLLYKTLRRFLSKLPAASAD